MANDNNSGGGDGGGGGGGGGSSSSSNIVRYEFVKLRPKDTPVVYYRRVLKFLNKRTADLLERQEETRKTARKVNPARDQALEARQKVLDQVEEQVRQVETLLKQCGEKPAADFAKERPRQATNTSSNLKSSDEKAIDSAHDDLILSVARETATPKRSRGADGLSELEEEKSDDSDAESLPDRATMKQPVFQKTLDYEEFEPEAATSDIGSRIRGVLSGRKRKSTVDVDLTSPKKQTTDVSAPASSDEPDGSFLSVAKFDLKAVEPENKQNDHAQDGARSGSASEQIKKRRLGPAWTAVQLSPNDPDARRGWRPGPPLLQLHNEILQFVKLIGATKPENTARANDLESIRALTNELFPKSTVDVFGSYANDLCIPNSDVDMVLFGAPASAIFTLSRELSKRDMVEKIETISSARVPIIKMRLKGSPFEIDICFDKESGISTGQMVRKLVQEMPALRPLVLTIKYFLAQRDINETYRGGIGSHLCLCMIVSMLQQFRRRMLLSKDQQNDRVEDLEDLGALLLEFLDLYGRRFNYGKVAISLRHGGSYKTKASMAARQPRPGILSLENPEDPSQDLGSSSYNMYKVRKAFAHAHRMLTKKLSDFADGRTDTVLDGIIIPTNQLADRLSRLA